MPKTRAIDLTGQRFGRLTVVERAGTAGSNATWLCNCDCGNVKIVSARSLKTGNTKSCGCLFNEANAKRCVTHGAKKTRLYRIWQGMKRRCDTPSASCYKDYGGRGIAVCEEWLHDFPAFQNWAFANGYAEDLTIDRIDVNGNYCPDNCKWSNAETQANNKRTSHVETFNGETHTVSEWAKITGLSRGLIKDRLRLGWSIERALTEPIHAQTKGR